MNRSVLEKLYDWNRFELKKILWPHSPTRPMPPPQTLKTPEKNEMQMLLQIFIFASHKVFDSELKTFVCI